MRLILSFAMLSVCLFMAAGFATIAAVVVKIDPALGDRIGWTGMGIAALSFLISMIFIWTRRDR